MKPKRTANMAGGSEASRKRLRVGHRSERAAVNAVRTLLEDSNLVVTEIDGRADYGRDLLVDITEGNEITGAVIGIQVKGDRRFIRSDAWEMPATDKDLRFWADSSIPIVGVLRDPSTGELRWVNLTAYARTDPSVSPYRKASVEETGTRIVQLGEKQVLSSDTIANVIRTMQAYVRQFASPSLLGLFDDDDDQRRQAVADCWAIGRTDARALQLLRRCLFTLNGSSLHEGIARLSYATDHPDIFWHEDNWIPPEIERRVQADFVWSSQEICDLFCAVDYFEQRGAIGWDRGGLGQCVWQLVKYDPQLGSKLLPALHLALDAGELDSALRLLVAYQYLADDPLTAVNAAIDRHPRLRDHSLLPEVVDHIKKWGSISIY